MPSLFQFEFKHIVKLWEYRTILFKGFLLNYAVLPILAIAVGLATGDFGIAAGLFTIAVFSGGGMVMHWIKRSGGDTSLGFLLLFINVLAIALSLLMIHLFALTFAPHFGVVYDEHITVKRFAWAVAKWLIFVPLIASRIVRLFPAVVSGFQRYKKWISHTSIFIILFYLFGLQGTQSLREIYDFEPLSFAVAFSAVVIFYALVYLAARVTFRFGSPQDIAAFWHTVTRYLTLALVISTFTVSTFGASMLLPIMYGYVVQIPMAALIARRIKPQEEG